jgi:inhibitor of KinA sporulation pathway (predicted exonuclease)
MARTLDIALVIDLEATCWKGKPPDGQVSEIIEVGLCTLDLKSLERLEKRSILVRPERSKVSPFCTELTTLTQEQVDEGVSFADACRILRKEYDSKNRLFASYGDYDRRQFERQCSSRAVGNPFGPTHLNVKNLAALAFGWANESGLPASLDALGLKLEGTHHRGHDDAWNIAAILAALLKRSRA